MRFLALSLAAAGLSACLAYPKSYWTVKEGTARLDDDGKPVRIRAVLLRDCQSLDGQETQKQLESFETTTDARGHYRLPIHAVAWERRNYLSEAGCETHVQMYVCRPVCKEADDVDINVLEK